MGIFGPLYNGGTAACETIEIGGKSNIYIALQYVLYMQGPISVPEMVIHQLLARVWWSL